MRTRRIGWDGRTYFGLGDLGGWRGGGGNWMLRARLRAGSRSDWRRAGVRRAAPGCEKPAESRLQPGLAAPQVVWNQLVSVSFPVRGWVRWVRLVWGLFRAAGGRCVGPAG